jgi:molybdopterin adenylyltransferase
MSVRVGILTIPEPDEQATQVVQQKLQQHIPDTFLLLDRHAASHQHLIEEILRRWCDEEELDLVITIGGTLPAPGPSQHEIVPEATLAILERLLPGLPEAMRAHAQAQSDLALLDRGVAGIRGRSLVLNLPAGSAPALLFLTTVVDLIPTVIAHLQEQASAPRLTDVLEIEQVEEKRDQPTAALPLAQPTGLKSNEFAAFLQRRGQSGEGKSAE